MAAGFTAALERIATVIEGCDSSASWKRSQQRLTTLKADARTPGLDYKYWLGAEPTRAQPESISGSHLTMHYAVNVELCRYFGGGDKLDKHYYGLMKTLEAEGNIVEQSIMSPLNYATSTTGILLINMDKPASMKEPTSQQPTMLWLLAFDMTVRQAQVATAV